MTNKEAIKMQKAINAGLKETGKDHPYRDALIAPMKESCDMAIEALKGMNGDTISRTDAIDAVAYAEDGKDAQRILEGLVSTIPEQSAQIQDILQFLDERLHPIISPEHWNVYSELHDMISMLPSAQPDVPDTNVGDTISRQAAIDTIKALWNDAPSAQHVSAMFDCEDAIRVLPSAQPDRKTGHWIINSDGYYPYCSECRMEPKSGDMTDFCPHCKADMRGEQDDSRT